MTGFEQFCAIVVGIIGTMLVLINWQDAWAKRGGSDDVRTDDAE
jgi:hypothetical protein